MANNSMPSTILYSETLFPVSLMTCENCRVWNHLGGRAAESLSDWRFECLRGRFEMSVELNPRRVEHSAQCTVGCFFSRNLKGQRRRKVCSEIKKYTTGDAI